ncbi:hypothetical protein OXX80_009529, partial [Metschnikowia pulcherrima]
MSNQSTGNGNKSNSADFETPTLSENVLEYTPTKEIPNLVNHLKTSFRKDSKTHSLQFRLNQLRNIYFALQDN